MQFLLSCVMYILTTLLKRYVLLVHYSSLDQAVQFWAKAKDIVLCC